MKPKTSGVTSGPELQSQPHGGALLDGGVPGHRGAGGRPPSVIRQHCRGSFDQRVAVLEKIADDDGATVTDRLRAIDMLGKYGLGTRADITSDDKEIRNSEDTRAKVLEYLANAAERDGEVESAKWYRFRAANPMHWAAVGEVKRPRSVILEQIESLKRELESAPEFCPWDAV